MRGHILKQARVAVGIHGQLEVLGDLTQTHGRVYHCTLARTSTLSEPVADVRGNASADQQPCHYSGDVHSCRLHDGLAR